MNETSENVGQDKSCLMGQEQYEAVASEVAEIISSPSMSLVVRSQRGVLVPQIASPIKDENKLSPVVISIYDSVASIVDRGSLPQGVAVIIRDYEVPEDWEGDDVEVDPDGGRHQKIILGIEDA